MSEQLEVSYQWSADASHPTWSGIEVEIPSVCPECGAEGILVADAAQDEVVEGAQKEGETPSDVTVQGDASEEMSEVDVAKYRITGLVDYFDEQGVIRGQFPIGSVQELPVEIGAKCVEDGRAELIENSPDEVE